MATFNRNRAVAFGSQSVEGTADATISALSGSLNLADGIVRGDADVGDDKSGIEATFTRVEDEGGFVTGGFTALDGDFIKQDVAFSFTFQLAGPRTGTTTPVDSEFEQDKGIKAIFDSMGLGGSPSIGNPTVGWKYKPQNAGFVTCKLFDSGMAWVLKDVLCETATFDMTPAGIATVKCDFKAIVDSTPTVTFPTLDYEVQDSVNAPSVVGVVPSWGISDEVRGWESLTITIGNDLETTPDSAASTGESFEQVGRAITVSMTMKDTDTDFDFSINNLIAASAPTDDLKMTVGTAATGGDAAIAYQIEVSNLRVKTYKPSGASKATSEITAQATGVADGTEFFIAFL